MSKIWTTKELAKAAGKTRQGIRWLIQEGRIEAVKIGRDWQIEDEEARRYLASLRDKKGD